MKKNACNYIKLLCFSLVVLTLFVLTGCKKASVRKVERSIEKIGVVSVEKETLIQNAREAFDLLTVDEKEEVVNAVDLENAESQLAVSKVDTLIENVGDFDDTTEEKISQIEDEIQKLSAAQKNDLVNSQIFEGIKSDYHVWCVEQAINQIGDLAELTYSDKNLVAEARNAYAELDADEQNRVSNSNILDEAIAAIDSLAFEELENNATIALMKKAIESGFSGNQITYTLDRTNRNYIIEMAMNAEASSAYFLYPAIAENLIKSIKSNCEKICKDFYESGTKPYDVDCTFIMNDCYGGEIFTIVNGEAQ